MLTTSGRKAQCAFLERVHAVSSWKVLVEQFLVEARLSAAADFSEA